MPALIREVRFERPRHGLRVIVAGIGVAFVIAALSGLSPARTMCFGGAPSKTDIAHATVKKYAFEAFPSWAIAHHRRSCPRSLRELHEYMSDDDVKDPWGNPYYLACGASAIPKPAKGVWVVSAGEDGVFGTEDDIRSDE